jgi:hypothetical protein
MYIDMGAIITVVFFYLPVSKMLRYTAGLTLELYGSPLLRCLFVHDNEGKIVQLIFRHAGSDFIIPKLILITKTI